MHEDTVATALTVYGIETNWKRSSFSTPGNVATALTVYGIETCPKPYDLLLLLP